MFLYLWLSQNAEKKSQINEYSDYYSMAINLHKWKFICSLFYLHGIVCEVNIVSHWLNFES